MSSAFRRTSYASVAAGTATPPYPHFNTSRAAQQRDDPGSSGSTPQQARSQPPTEDMEGMDIEKTDSDLAKYKPYAALHDVAYFTPSYLRRSRHMERLEGQHRQKQSKAKDFRDQHARSGLGSRQQSSSSLHRTSPASHRGVYHEVIERMPPVGERARPIPTKWNEGDKCNGLEILGGGLEVKYQGAARTPDDAAAVRTDHPIPDDCGLYYYEVTVLSRGKEGLIGIGFSSHKPSLSRLPGWEDHSWGYHGDDGYSFACSSTGKPYGPKFSSLDVIGCGINFRTSSAFFTKNGIFLGDAFHDITVTRLYPSVGIKKPGEHLRANFGQTPFVFDIDGMMERERRLVRAEINEPDSSRPSLLPGLDEKETIDALIAQYLAHEGFTETGTQFIQDVKEQRASLGLQSSQPPLSIESDDANVSHRQKIRSAILTGDIDLAFKYLNTFFPHVLEAESNRDIYFRLRCRKFIEMILRSYEIQSSLMAGGNGQTNGHGKAPPEPTPDGMELDLHNGSTATDKRPDYTDSMDMSTESLKGTPPFAETKSAELIRNGLLSDAIQYGMGLQAEFNQDPRKEVQKALSDTFALIAYTDARESGLAEMMEGKGRVEIAEQVNGAILVSLGKPRSTLLERLCAQTEVMLEMLSEHGGAASFVNLKRDYLQ